MTNAAEATRTLVIERVVPHAPEKVWRALTQTPSLDDWMLKSDFQAVVGHKFNFRSEPNPHWDGVIESEVLAVEPHRELVYRWNALGLESVVTWTLTPTAEGTTLRMEHAGFAPDQTYAYEGAKAGWGRMLDTLVALLPRV
ncbi:MAG: polyketide cyclase [Cyanobacteria bacterium RYN_339]|nr:polyketide cyclase [Cyanobacteria bacterium RYN_339]